MKQARDFIQEIFDVSDLRLDRRFKSWAKWVDSVDESKTDGYAFVGGFISPGTIEVEIGQPRLILAQATSGSAKYNYPYYALIRLEADGTLTNLNITDNGEKLGWAIRMKPRVSQALNELNLLEPVSDLFGFQDEELIGELTRRGYHVSAKE